MEEESCSQSSTVLQWALFGVFMLLAFLSRFIVKMVFKAVFAVVKSALVSSSLQSQLLYPVSLLVMLGFLQIAFFVYFPWPCELTWLETALDTILYVLILAGAFFLIQRTFRFLELILSIFEIPPRFQEAVMEGLGVLQIAVLVIVGLLFFVDIIARLFGGNSGDFAAGTFLFEINIITLLLCFVLVPMLRDAMGGFHLLFNQPFELEDELGVDGKLGKVERIGLFAVVLKDCGNGTMLLIPCSRFVEKEFTIFPKRLGVVQFKLALGRNGKVNRHVLVELEHLLTKREYFNTSVSVSQDEEDEKNHLNVQFQIPKHKVNNQEINLAKFALVDFLHQLDNKLD
ncbi:hypothetical protein BASA81_009843 [Batrachochytrium salamandrivorans]|nr:hypothetical protein BASA81_009843 [Batrachochytrium salamandrivorans]